MKNGRCRLHGGLSTDPQAPECLARIRAAQTTHGMRTAAMEQMRTLVWELRAGAKRLGGTEVGSATAVDVSFAAPVALPIRMQTRRRYSSTRTIR
jgi:hypothetical protein